MKTLKCLFLCSAIVLSVSVGSVFACGCGSLGGPEQTIENIVGHAVNTSIVVFQGKAIGIEYRKGLLTDFMSVRRDESGLPIAFETITVRFAVDRWWKGDMANEINR